MADEMNRRGQMALWIILAIAFVALTFLIFITLNKKPLLREAESENPQMIIDKCVKDAVNEAIDIMLPQGGFIEPKNFKIFGGKKISYICQNEWSFKPCTMQHPALLKEIIEEIYNFTNPKIDQCFQRVKENFESKSWNVELGKQEVNISLARGKIYASIIREIVITKDQQTRRFEKFNSEINNPVYDLGRIAIEIANQEAQYCNFEYGGYMMLYPQFKITRELAGDSTKIYSIKDIKSEKEMNIAIRGCVIVRI
jgi:hypothetical protein